MYNFVDTTEVSDAALLPSEAMKINGEYIENQITGYRTLYVSGREALAPELTTYKTGSHDGERLAMCRYPARVLTIGYQLIADSADAFREAYNDLGAILNVEDAELIFADEPDKFFTGTPSGLGEIDPGRNAVTSEFEITCLDPFKYSVEEYEATPTLDDGTTIAVNYGGTYKAYPTFEVDFPDEDASCGFVAFVNDAGKMIQVGDPDEVDGTEHPMSQTLVNDTFNTTYNSAKWPANVATLLSLGSTLAQTGAVYVSTDTQSRKCLRVNSFGSGTKWHGPSVTCTIPAQSSGHVGAKSFTLSFRLRFLLESNYTFSLGGGGLTAKHETRQLGMIQTSLVDSTTNKVVAALVFLKSATGTKASVLMYVGTKCVKRIDNIDISGGGTSTIDPSGISDQSCCIQKSGGDFLFSYGIMSGKLGSKYAFYDASLANTEVHKICFYFAQYSNYPWLSDFFLYSAKFVNSDCETWKDVPNKFSESDHVTLDCGNGEILFNRVSTPELGALGNDWEDFHLKPGQNQIGFAWSDWTENPPSIKMKYREVFL